VANMAVGLVLRRMTDSYGRWQQRLIHQEQQQQQPQQHDAVDSFGNAAQGDVVEQEEEQDQRARGVVADDGDVRMVGGDCAPVTAAAVGGVGEGEDEDAYADLAAELMGELGEEGSNVEREVMTGENGGDDDDRNGVAMEVDESGQRGVGSAAAAPVASNGATPARPQRSVQDAATAAAAASGRRGFAGVGVGGGSAAAASAGTRRGMASGGGSGGAAMTFAAAPAVSRSAAATSGASARRPQPQAMERSTSSEGDSSTIGSNAFEILSQSLPERDARAWAEQLERDHAAQSRTPKRRPLTRLYRTGAVGVASSTNNTTAAPGQSLQSSPSTSPVTRLRGLDADVAHEVMQSSLRRVLQQQQQQQQQGGGNAASQVDADAVLQLVDANRSTLDQLYLRELENGITSRIESDNDFDPESFTAAAKRFRRE